MKQNSKKYFKKAKGMKLLSMKVKTLKECKTEVNTKT